MQDKKVSIKIFFPAAFLFLFGFIIYSNTLYAPFLFDDEDYIVNNYAIRNLSNFTDFSGTRYIGFLSFAINYHFGGLNTFGYHLVNVIIHILNAILVYFLIQLTLDMLKCRQWAMDNGQLERPITYNLLPIACSLIFLVHPVQTQAVTYIAQRFTSLAAFFYLLAIVLYIKARIKGQGSGVKGQGKTSFIYFPLYILSILSAILAMKTKEISFTLPFIIILYEFTFLNSPSPPFLKGGRGDLKRFLCLIPFLLAIVIIPLSLFLPESNIGVGEYQRQLKIQEMATLSKYTHLLTQFNVIVTYIRLLFFPVNQHINYSDYPLSHSIFEPKTFSSFLFLLSIFSFAVYLYIRSCKTRSANGILASFGIFWFFITLSVESSIMPIKNAIYEHRIYLPSIGAVIAFNSAALHLFDYIKPKVSILFAICIFLLIITVPLTIATYKRNLIWKDALTMALDEFKKSPNNKNRADMWNAVGMRYLEKGILDEAEKGFKNATKLQSDFYIAYNNLGLIYLKKGLKENAEMEFKKAIKIKPDYSAAHENLGTIYLERGLFDYALREYETALVQNLSPRLCNKIGTLYLRLGDVNTAIKAFKEAIRLEPRFVIAYSNLGFAYFDKGDYDNALEMHRKAIAIEPKFANAHYGLAEVYEKKGMIDKAVRHYKEYIRYADPNERWVERARKRIVELDLQ